MSYIDDRNAEAYGFIIALVVSIYSFVVGTYVGGVWLIIAISHLLAFEWKSNPDRYEWFGSHPNFSAAFVLMVGVVVWTLVAFLLL